MVSDPGVAAGSGPSPASTAVAMALMSAKPVSAPTGRAPDRQSLTPLYCAGLCDAVNMAPGAPKRPAAKYTRSVDTSPTSMTSTPWDIKPSAKAATSSTPDGRMSRPTRTVGDPAKRAKATPKARAMAASS